ncbi:hypothetical protein [Flavobacterium sp. 102]|uniref:hypothetical protein n=1 Tax=Flavobacterium sp. 102 TaxID=2135623 RepID=UPI000EAC2C6F|nr:hypothetical protein [Flavobacterium sp. 102]RKS02842.1 hypothetical protein C8C84_2572 [Flavobacterium sp. 102]
MVKINYPPYPAKFYLNYTGRRNTLIQTFSTFTEISIEFDRNFTFQKESLSTKVHLIDGQEIFLGLISRNIYTLKNNDWIKNDDAFINLYQIIIDKNFTYIKGSISFDINLNGEVINDTYTFKIFLNAGQKVNDYIINSEVECENFYN